MSVTGDMGRAGGRSEKLSFRRALCGWVGGTESFGLDAGGTGRAGGGIDPFGGCGFTGRAGALLLGDFGSPNFGCGIAGAGGGPLFGVVGPPGFGCGMAGCFGGFAFGFIGTAGGAIFGGRLGTWGCIGRAGPVLAGGRGPFGSPGRFNDPGSGGGAFPGLVGTCARAIACFGTSSFTCCGFTTRLAGGWPGIAGRFGVGLRAASVDSSRCRWSAT